MASADPASDADAAITAAWDAGGGTTGTLGGKDGGVYPVGAGFGQNFAFGRIYFTPETGAHIMQGAILDKYLSLGGPVDGDLGFPNIDEGAGKAPGSRNTTFSAADNPVIFFTPDTGAQVVRGPYQRGLGQARRVGRSARRAEGGRGIPRRRGQPGLHRRSGVVEPEDRSLHDHPAGIGRSACGPGGSG